MARDSVSWPDLVSLLGEEAAHDLCMAYGGLPLYVGRRPTEELMFNIGERAALTLCKQYAGNEIIPAMGPLKEPDIKALAIPMLESGMSQLEVARELRSRGVMCHIRTVQGAAQIMNQGRAKPRKVPAKNVGVYRLPDCLMVANGVGGENGGAR